MLNRIIVGLAAVSALTSCGGRSDGSAPSPTPAATITITSSGVNPKSVTVTRGSQVQFVNNDSVPHDMSSNPHPEHTDCPEINAVGFLNPNQSRQTGNLNSTRTCGFHDHNNPDRTALQGSIIIQ